jgi:D-glycero-D-manno-heptose 1,7-bisphosphate phosphatase
MPRPGLLLDRDGTVIVECDYLGDPAGVILIPEAIPALRLAQKWGCALALVTNQSGVARGKFGVDAVHAVHQRLQELLAVEGIQLDGIWFCPHHPQGSVPEYSRSCDCRKPSPGMLLQAMRTLDLDPTCTLMVGDKLADVQAGEAAGVQAALVRTGYGTTEPGEIPSSVIDAKHLEQAVQQWGQRWRSPTPSRSR